IQKLLAEAGLWPWVPACAGRNGISKPNATRSLASVRARLRRLERQRRVRVPARAHAGDVHAAGEGAIGKTHPGAPEAALVEPLDAEAWLARPSLHRPAPPPPPGPPPPPPPPPSPGAGVPARGTEGCR